MVPVHPIADGVLRDTWARLSEITDRPERARALMDIGRRLIKASEILTNTLSPGLFYNGMLTAWQIERITYRDGELVLTGMLPTMRVNVTLEWAGYWLPRQGDYYLQWETPDRVVTQHCLSDADYHSLIVSV